MSIDKAIESYIDNRVHDGYELDDLYDPKCPYCQHGIVPGDTVPYGSTTAQLPGYPCECLYEYGLDQIRKEIEEGITEIVNGKVSR